MIQNKEQLINALTKFRTDYPEIAGNRMNSIPDGWYPMILSMLNEMKHHCESKQIGFPIFLQIKQKLGGLRAYFRYSDDVSPEHEQLHTIVSKYEQIAYTICEFTGLKGQSYNANGWYIVAHQDIIAELECIKNKKNYHDLRDEILNKYQFITDINN